VPKSAYFEDVTVTTRRVLNRTSERCRYVCNLLGSVAETRHTRRDAYTIRIEQLYAPTALGAVDVRRGVEVERLRALPAETAALDESLPVLAGMGETISRLLGGDAERKP
jgi:hypothetical protein